ncbi:hypothetical protein RJ639_030697 [Escallonia herrerae]|uniref:Integrase catalytic domain-containing protein n=1 Tax=Escallonia herrerae TaxID=1293975 RepID=A0AA88X6E1_9ASTE|nr:hypothetical protein RJ639_030697 [Escallonia herrerae]
MAKDAETSKPKHLDPTLEYYLSSQANSGASVITYYTKLLGMWDELLTLSPLESCGCPKGTGKMNWYQDLQTYQFLMGLDDKYATLHTQIINMDPFPNIDRVYAMVMQEESHRGITGSHDTTSVVSFHAQNGPPTARSSGFVSATAGDPDRTLTGRPWCTFCHRVGHTQEKCYLCLGIAPPGLCRRDTEQQPFSQPGIGRPHFRSSGPDTRADAMPHHFSGILSIGTALRRARLDWHSRTVFPDSTSRAMDIFGLVHCDIWGPYRVSTISGVKYFLTIVDDYSRAVWVYLMHDKGQTGTLLRNFCNMVHTQFGKLVKIIRSDNGHEFDSQPMTQFYNDHGILHQTSMVDTPKQNGRVERKHRHILEVAQALRFQANLPIEFWGECVLTAAHLINRTPSAILKHKTPHELFFQKVPSYSHLRVFGCLCYAHTKFADKFAPRSRRCVFLGYPPGKKGWRVYDLETNQFFFSRDVKFEETVFPFTTPLCPSPTPATTTFCPAWDCAEHPMASPLVIGGDTPPVTGGDPPPSPAATLSPGLSGIIAGPDQEISSSASPPSSLTALSPTLGRGKRQKKVPSVLKDYRKYALDILSESGLSASKPAAFPMEQNHGLALAGGPLLSDPGPYRRLIGRLVYLTITRPDICYAVHVLSKFMQSPRSQHWDVALRVLRYLKAAPGQGLFLPADSPLQIYAFCDSDWASCPLTRRSVTGYFVSLGNFPISWRTKKQPTVSRSSAEAEYRSMVVTTCELTWLKSFLLSLGVHHDRPMRLFCDNQAALHIASNPVFHERTKHIEIDCHYVREKLFAGNISTAHVRTTQQVADIFTKALGVTSFIIFAASWAFEISLLPLEGEYQPGLCTWGMVRQLVSRGKHWLRGIDFRSDDNESTRIDEKRGSGVPTSDIGEAAVSKSGIFILFLAKLR